MPKPRPKKYCTISLEVSNSPKKLETCPRVTAIKSQSLPRNSSLHQFDVDATLGNVLRLPPAELAAQITLLDFKIFSSIQTEELGSCGWTKKDKCITSPNIVAFTRRFNNISFWVVQEILNGVSPKERAEVLSYFIKLAKKLHEFNNLHSLFAIISAMRSASIYRMSNTWNALPKKDKQTLDRLASLFSEDNNWQTLREYLETLKLPCIPYLGLFLTDLVYIDLAHPHKTNGLEPEQRRTKMNNILRIISNYQASDYSSIEPNESMQEYLLSIRYIEELQNIFEEEQYKKSLLLEPKLQPLNSTPCSSKESVVSSLNLSPAKSSSMRVGSVGPTPNKFVAGHRKCQSLGTNIFNRFQPGRQTICAINSAFGRHLLDDSELHDQRRPSTSEADSGIDDLRSPLGSLDFQGYVRRKTLLKDNKKPTVSSWQRFWIQIWANSLIYFPPKSLKGCERSDFKSEPSKIRSLEGWRATSVENTQHGNTFQLINTELGHIYKFRTTSPEIAKQWLRALQENNGYTNHDTYNSRPKGMGSGNLMSFE